MYIEIRSWNGTLRNQILVALLMCSNISLLVVTIYSKSKCRMAIRRREQKEDDSRFTNYNLIVLSNRFCLVVNKLYFCAFWHSFFSSPSFIIILTIVFILLLLVQLIMDDLHSSSRTTIILIFILTFLKCVSAFKHIVVVGWDIL